MVIVIVNLKEIKKCNFKQIATSRSGEKHSFCSLAYEQTDQKEPQTDIKNTGQN